MSKNPLFRNGKENEKVTRNPHADPDHHYKLIRSLLDVHSMPMPAKFGRPPFPRSSVILPYSMTEWQTERSHNLRLVGGDKYIINRGRWNCRTWQFRTWQWRTSYWKHSAANFESHPWLSWRQY